MIDREYVKLNTSIHTGSNSRELIRDQDGNIQATIELRLPDNLFDNNSQTRKIDHVSMQTSKMRLSMDATPIAEIPVDVTKTTAESVVSTCQLDVYPFALSSDGKLYPTATRLSKNALPNYKKHPYRILIHVIYEIKDPSDPENVLTGSWDIMDGRFAKGYFNMDDMAVPPGHPIYEALKTANANTLGDHMLNMVVPKGSQEYDVTGDVVDIYSIGTLEQMFQDAIESAISYACTTIYNDGVNTNNGNPTWPYVAFFFKIGDACPPPPPKYNGARFFTTIPDASLTETLGFEYSGWAYLTDAEVYNDVIPSYIDPNDMNGHHVSSLDFSVKPTVRCGDDSFSISYDTAPFNRTIPILYNPAYVDNEQMAESMSLDKLRSEAWIGQKPVKRVYSYGVHNEIDSTTDTSTGYNFTLNTRMDSGPLNIIGNKATAETFSFLPWKKIDLKSIPQAAELEPGEYQYTYLTHGGPLYDTYQHLQHTYILANENSHYRAERYQTNAGNLKVEFCVDETLIGTTEEPNMANILNMDNWYGIQLLYESRDSTSGTSPVPIEVGTIIYDESTEMEHGTYPSSPPNVPNQYYQTNDVDEALQTREWIDHHLEKEVTSEIVISTGLGGYICKFLTAYDINHTDTRNWSNPPSFAEQWNACGETFQPTSAYASAHYLPFNEWTETDQHLNNIAGKSFPMPIYPSSPGANDGNCTWGDGWATKNLDINGTTTTCHVFYLLIPLAPRDMNTWDLLYIPPTTSLTQQVANVLEWDDQMHRDFAGRNFLTRDYYQPNLDLEDGRYFYMLDGTANNVTIGPQEVVKTSSGVSEPYHVEVTEERSTVTTPGTRTLIYDTKSMHLLDGVNWVIVRAALDYADLSTYMRYIRYHVVMHGSAFSGDLSTAKLVLDDGDDQPVSGYNERFGYVVPAEQTRISETETSSAPLNPVVTTSTDAYSSGGDLSLGTTTETRVEHVKDISLRSLEPTPGVEDRATLVMLSNLFDAQALIRFMLQIFQTSGQSFDPLFSNVSYVEVPMRRAYACHKAHLEEQIRTDYFIPTVEPRYQIYDGIADLSEGLYYWNLYYPIGFLIPKGKHTFLLTPITFKKPLEVFPPWNLSPIERLTEVDDVANKEITITKTTTVTETEPVEGQTLYKGNVHLTFTWDKLPMVVMSPIQSIVLTLEGIQVNQEYQPVNMSDTTGSALTSTVPIIENYYSLAQTLRDLHDEIIVVKEDFDSTATYTLTNTSGKERTLRLSAKYITKGGRLRQIYIPPNGVFSLQLTFGLSYYQV